MTIKILSKATGAALARVTGKVLVLWKGLKRKGKASIAYEDAEDRILLSGDKAICASARWVTKSVPRTPALSSVETGGILTAPIQVSTSVAVQFYEKRILIWEIDGEGMWGLPATETEPAGLPHAVIPYAPSGAGATTLPVFSAGFIRTTEAGKVLLAGIPQGWVEYVPGNPYLQFASTYPHPHSYSAASAVLRPATLEKTSGGWVFQWHGLTDYTDYGAEYHSIDDDFNGRLIHLRNVYVWHDVFWYANTSGWTRFSQTRHDFGSDAKFVRGYNGLLITSYYQLGRDGDGFVQFVISDVKLGVTVFTSSDYYSPGYGEGSVISVNAGTLVSYTGGVVGSTMTAAVTGYVATPTGTLTFDLGYYEDPDLYIIGGGDISVYGRNKEFSTCSLSVLAKAHYDGYTLGSAQIQRTVKPDYSVVSLPGENSLYTSIAGAISVVPHPAGSITWYAENADIGSGIISTGAGLQYRGWVGNLLTGEAYLGQLNRSGPIPSVSDDGKWVIFYDAYADEYATIPSSVTLLKDWVEFYKRDIVAPAYYDFRPAVSHDGTRVITPMMTSPTEFATGLLDLTKINEETGVPKTTDTAKLVLPYPVGVANERFFHSTTGGKYYNIDAVANFQSAEDDVPTYPIEYVLPGPPRIVMLWNKTMQRLFS